MAYTMKQVTEKTHLSAYTLRYYDKEGLLPFVHRTSNGNRSFSDEDLEWISIICCLKGTGMSVKQIREYIALCLQGDETLEQRRQIFVEQKESVLRQIEELNKHLEKVNHKLKIYEKACEEYRRKKGRK